MTASAQTPHTKSAAEQVVRKRNVFFVPGYDPIAPRRYRELYRREAARQSAISGYEIAVEGQKERDGYYAWSTWARVDGLETQSTIEFLTWDDIVKSSMDRSILSSYLVMLRTVWIYFASGAFFALVRVRPHPMIAALYPVVVLLAQLEAGLLVMWLIWWLLSVVGPLPNLAGWLIGLGGLLGLMRFFYKNDVGQVIPMMSFLPAATELRENLNYLSQSKDIAWVDISAPGDGGCFALSDPVHVTGVAPPEEHKHWPKVISAAYRETMSPEALAKTKWRFFRRHVQYLCAFDKPGAYDYFQITAGPRTLNDRFAWRGATASRKETPLSPYRDF